MNAAPKGRPRLFPPRPVPPCSACGDEGGIVPRGQKRPGRISGEPFGIAGPICVACYQQRQDRRRARQAAASKRRRARLAAAAAETDEEGRAREEARAREFAQRAEIEWRRQLVFAAKDAKKARTGRDVLSRRELNAILPQAEPTPTGDGLTEARRAQFARAASEMRRRWEDPAFREMVRRRRRASIEARAQAEGSGGGHAAASP